MEECRLCGNKTASEDIKMRLASDVKGRNCVNLQRKLVNFIYFAGFLNFKEFVEYFCRILLDEDPLLPQACCRACFRTITKFCIYTCTVESQQNKFKNRLPPDDKPTNQEVPCTSNNISKETSSSLSSTKRSNDDEQPATKNSDNEEVDEIRKSKRRKTGRRMALALNEMRYSDKKERVETVSCGLKIN